MSVRRKTALADCLSAVAAAASRAGDHALARELCVEVVRLRTEVVDALDRRARFAQAWALGSVLVGLILGALGAFGVVA